MPKTEEARTAKKAPENVMYLGKSVVNKITHGTVYKDGILPAEIQKMVDEFPPMKSLFVPLSELEKGIESLNNGALGAIARQCAAKFTGGRK